MKKLLGMMAIVLASSSIAFGALGDSTPFKARIHSNPPTIRISPEMRRRQELARLRDLLAKTTDKQERKAIEKQIKELEEVSPNYTKPAVSTKRTHVKGSLKPEPII